MAQPQIDTAPKDLNKRRRSAFAEIRRNAVVGTGKRLRRTFDALIGRYSVIPNVPVLSRKEFDWAPALENEWEAIRDEAMAVLNHRNKIPPLSTISPDHARIAKGDDWRSFFLWGYGFRIDENCERCPKTAEIVERIPGLQTAMFSILAPGAHIPPHRGVTKAIINCHLALVTPAGAENCWIRIDRDRYGWRNGETLIFDDTFEHEVRNATDEDRIVLLLQVSRPVRFPGNLAAKLFFGAVRRSPFISDARENLRDWRL